MSHYDTLGLKPPSDAKEIRGAYRRLVLLHHPDRSSDPRSSELFIKITEAYEVLIEPERKRRYDEFLTRKIETKAAPRAAPPPPVKPAKPRTASQASPDASRMAVLFGQGRFQDAETMAHRLLAEDDRLAVAYAVLGDIARQRGDLRTASKMYAYALQMDPRNDLYLRKNEELVRASSSIPDVRQATDGSHILATFVGFALCAVACTYVVLSREKPVLPELGPISTWTVGLVVMLLLGGVSIGASLSVGRMLDRFQSVSGSASGSAGPTVALASIAIINFWAAAALYALLGISQNAFNLSTTRLMVAVAGLMAAFAAAAGLSGHIDPGQVLLWGGNLAYLGGICGWMATDSLRG